MVFPTFFNFSLNLAISTAYFKLSNYKVHKHLFGGSLKCRFWLVGLGLPRACISKQSHGWCWLALLSWSAVRFWPRGPLSQAHSPLGSALHLHVWVVAHECWSQPQEGSLLPSLLSCFRGVLGALLCLRVAEECTCFHRYCGDNEVLKKSAFSFSLLCS